MALVRPGPVELTGKYGSRAELEAAVAILHDGGMTPKKIAAEVVLSPSTVHGILKKHREAKRLARERHNKALISRAWR